MQAISTKSPEGAHSDKLAAGEPLPIRVGDVVAAKYTVDAILGVGGMGVVAAATHTALGQRVALKVMRTARMNPETADRFLREARAAVSLKSSHVAKVLDVGTLDSGLPYMVMELLEGSDLSDKLEKRGALPFAEAIDYVLQACDAISEAHALGIVHRDLKPENLFVTERRDGAALVKVLDFGISKVSSTIEATEGPTSRRAITHESTVMGSPMYMSPEQVRSAKHVDGRTDIWALGAILYELVAGHGPFWAESVPDIFVKVLDKPAPRLEDAVRDAPAGLAETIARCLEKDREKRFQTVDQLAAALANLGVKPASPTIPPWDRSTDIPIDETGDGPVPQPAVVSAPFGLMPSPPSARRVTAETFVLPGRPRARRNKLAVVFAFLAISGVAFGAVGLYRHVPSPRETSSASPAMGTAMDDTANANASAKASASVAAVSAPIVQTPSSASAPSEAPSRPTATGPRSRSGSANAARSSQPPTSKQPPAAAATSSANAPPLAPPPSPAGVPTLRRTDW
ncbi:MAG: Serine/threonine-protein kinase pkn3 [Labilithrix sp.]|nr:Serine/threonine-protein kinase pkn3 [Labilithrix sp.]